MCNAHAITELQCSEINNSRVVEETSQVRIATAIYPTASLMNHSCDPTIISSFCRDLLVVRVVKDVPVGGEIFNCYGPHYRRMEFSERQRCLREQYFFHCQCEPCTQGEKQEYKFKAYRCESCSGPLVQSGVETYTCQDCKCSCQVDLGKVEQADFLFQTGVELLQEDKILESLVELTKCYDIRTGILYKYHKHLSEVQDCLARCYAMSGDFSKAAKFLKESIVIVEQTFGAESIELANELQKLSEVLISAQSWKEALSANQKACSIFETHYGKSHDAVKELLSARKELLQVINAAR